MRLAIVLTFPLLLLALDFYIFPLLYLTKIRHANADIKTLISERTIQLGTYQGHDIYVSLDDIYDPQYLNVLNSRPTALVISAFVHEDQTASGALQMAVLSRVHAEAPDDYIILEQKFDEFTVGQVANIPLHVPKKNYHRFPVDAILVITLPYGHPNPQDVQAGLHQGFTIADRTKISNVVVPCIATRWDDISQNSLSLPHFVTSFFQSIPIGNSPNNIYLSLYSRWPTFQLERAIQTINATWQEQIMESNGIHEIYRLDIRLIFLFIPICLGVCAFIVRLTFKNTLIIVLAFVGLAFASKAWVDLIAPGQDRIALFVKLGILAIIAFGFPMIVTWNPKDIFSDSGSSGDET